VDRKKQVVIGELPAEFLRLDAQTSSNMPSQVFLDEQAARNLHNQLNTGVATSPGYFAGGFVPPNSRGRLSITLVQARLTKNYGFVKMDPYCRIRVGNTVFETPTDAGGGKNPNWNRTVHCYLPQGIDSIYLEIFDERAFSTDERIAWNHITIPPAVFNSDTIDDWYSLSGQQGDAKEGMINLVMTLYPITAPHVAYIPMSQPVVQQQPVVVIPGAAAAAAGIPAGLPPGIYQTTPFPQQQVPQGPLYTEEDIKELQDMFPNMDVEVIKSIMEEKRGNKDATVNALLLLSDDSHE